VDAALPATMGASVLTATGRLERRLMEVPRPRADELVVRVLATGICGSDVAVFRGCHPYKTAPIVLGHELCGVVAARGSQVSRFAPGERVCAASFSHCERCEQCLRGAIHLCPDKLALNHRGWHGSFAEFVVLKENMAFALPAGVPDALGALVEPLSIGLHAVALAGTPQSGALVIVGAGNIGLCCLMSARRLGLRAICVDVRRSARELALRLGADAVLDAARADVGGSLRALLGREADAIVLASGHRGALDGALALAAGGGRVVAVSYFDDREPIAANRLVAREVSLVGSALSSAADMRAAISWIERGDPDPAALITHTLPLDAAGEGMRLMCDPALRAGKVVLDARAGEGA
jgi:threonine dehydrogenase-like Zn-dependent dehydrogenase